MDSTMKKMTVKVVVLGQFLHFLLSASLRHAHSMNVFYYMKVSRGLLIMIMIRWSDYSLIFVTGITDSPYLERLPLYSDITMYSRITLCMRSANERRHYNVMSFLIGRAHKQNEPWYSPSDKHSIVGSLIHLVTFYFFIKYKNICTELHFFFYHIYLSVIKSSCWMV